MDLVDLVDEHDLQEDEWSLSKPKFGVEGLLEVVGWSGRNKGGNKLYILECNKCKEDSELFGDGYFRSLKGNLVKGIVPCGCSKIPKWTKEQFAILCSRKAKELGYKFLGFTGDWKGRDTVIKISCEKHGKWSSGTNSTLINGGRGCPGCRVDAVVEAATKPDDVMIQSFFKSGTFHPDTKFWRSDRKDSRGTKVYWYMSCPECGEVGESFSGDLQKGQRPCACSRSRQTECYINWVLDGENPVAIKFGIAINSKQRIKRQDRVSVYTIKQHSVHVFPSVQQCKQAERECRQDMETGVILKRDMRDGYTETTWVYNLEKIVEIYERNGGVKIDHY